jgi:hypothetical protein
MMNAIYKEYLALKTKEEYAGDDMKVIAMVDWHIAGTYPDYWNQENREEFEKCVADFLVKNELKYSGWQHQGSDCGSPLVKYKGVVYGVAVGFQHWAEIMLLAWDKDNKDEYAYVQFKFHFDGEENISEKIKTIIF